MSNTVRNFNAKITRTIKKHPELKAFLPEKLSVKEVNEKIKTRQDFNRELKSYQRFLKKGAEKPIMSDTGIKTTTWEKREIGYKVAQINRNRTREAKRADVSTTKGTMGSIVANNLKPKKYNLDKIKASDWEKYIQTVEYQVMSNYTANKIEQYKANYLQAIIRNLGTGKKAMELIELVEGLDASMMYYSFYDDPVVQIQFISDPLPAEEIAEHAINHWKGLI